MALPINEVVCGPCLDGVVRLRLGLLIQSHRDMVAMLSQKPRDLSKIADAATVNRQHLQTFHAVVGLELLKVRHAR